MVRTRAVQTCEACRKAKVRCDRGKPRCLRCSKTNRECSYPTEEPSFSHESSSASYTALSDPTSPNQVNTWLADRNEAASSSGSEVSETLDSTATSNVWDISTPILALIISIVRTPFSNICSEERRRNMHPLTTGYTLSQRLGHSTGYHAEESETLYLVFAVVV